jgi:peptidoglycan hydrolase-like protein with peptidoglycan-binding domain
VVRDDIVIVDRSRKIVATVPVGSGGGGAQLNNTGGAQVGSTAGGMNLGPQEIRQVQIALKEKGFYRGEPDGVLGPETTQAIITFQQQQGFQASGRIDTQTVSALGVSNLSGTSTTGQTGNTVQQPANQNVGAGQQGTQGGNQPAPSTAGTSGNNTMQQQPANQNVGVGQQGTGNQSGSQPSSTTGQSGQASQPSPTNQTGTNSQPAAPAPQSNNPNSGSSK